MNLNKRLILIFLGVSIVMISFYAFRITSNKEKILSKGELVNAKISKATGRGTTKSILVMISGVEYSAGETFGDYNNKVTGDLVAVHYLKNMNLVILDGEKEYLNSFFLEIMVILGGLLVVYGLFSKESNYSKYVPYTMRYNLDYLEESES